MPKWMMLSCLLASAGCAQAESRATEELISDEDDETVAARYDGAGEDPRATLTSAIGTCATVPDDASPFLGPYPNQSRSACYERAFGDYFGALDAYTSIALTSIVRITDGDVLPLYTNANGERRRIPYVEGLLIEGLRRIAVRYAIAKPGDVTRPLISSSVPPELGARAAEVRTALAQRDYERAILAGRALYAETSALYERERIELFTEQGFEDTEWTDAVDDAFEAYCLSNAKLGLNRTDEHVEALEHACRAEILFPITTGLISYNDTY